MRFSVVVPVYNVEKYLGKCLDSIVMQSYSDFELLVVNDGSPDGCQAIIEEYEKKYPNLVKGFVKENGGLSDARNYGIDRAAGEYLVFVDSDDFVNTDLLLRLNEEIENNNGVDVIGYRAKIVYDDNSGQDEELRKPVFHTIDGQSAIKAFIDNKYYFEPAWMYAYRREFWVNNNFEYAKGQYHEDFGLTPEVIMRAESVSSIDCLGYYYVQSSNSIIRNSSTEKSIKKAYDILSHFERLRGCAEKYISNSAIRELFNSYIANAVINQIQNLEGNERKKYITELNKSKVFDMLLADSLKRKAKKLFMKIKYRG